MKELFLDSANLDQIRELISTDAIQGVTTNPSLMAKEAKGVYTRKLLEICEVIQTHTKQKKHLSAEVITTDPKAMYEQAHLLSHALKGHDKISLHIKIPIMLQTLGVITNLHDDGIKVNATAAITVLQAKLAHDAGADIVSFFYRRGVSAGEDMDLEVGRFAKGLNRNSRIICGSIREVMDVYKCWIAGSDIVTAPYTVIEQMVRHKVTDESIAGFQKDIDAWLK